MGSFGGRGVGGEVGAGEVGVAGEGGAGLAVDEEADLGDAGKVGVEGGADGEDGEGFGFKAGGVAGGEGAGEVDDGELGAVIGPRALLPGWALVAVAAGGGQQEDLGDGAAPPGTGWAASGVA